MHLSRQSGGAPAHTQPIAPVRTPTPDAANQNPISFELRSPTTSTTTSPDAPLIKAQVATYKAAGIDALLWPWNAGSYPGYVFTNPPLSLAAGHFGLGFGTGAHAPDEYYVIESANPKVQGYDGAVMSFVEYLYDLGK